MAETTNARRVIPAGVGREPWRSAAETLLAESGCTVRKWRRGASGVAFTRCDDWGVEVPSPSNPLRFAVLAHEVAHQLRHRHNSLPRWEEEFQAWEYALDQFDRFDLPGRHEAVLAGRRSCYYAVAKAQRRTRKVETLDALVARFARFAHAYPLAEEVAA